MPIELNENGEIEKMTRDDYEKELKAIQLETEKANAAAKELQEKTEALRKAAEDGKVTEPKKAQPKSIRPHQHAAGGNMEELRIRLDYLKEEVNRIHLVTPEYAQHIQKQLYDMSAKVDGIYEYVNGRQEQREPRPKRKGFLGLW